MRLHLHTRRESRLATDDELTLITSYVGGFMTDAEQEAFELRLADDETFFDRVAPLLKAWHSSKPRRDAITVAAPPKKRSRAIIGARTGAGIGLVAAAVLVFFVSRQPQRSECCRPERSEGVPPTSPAAAPIAPGAIGIATHAPRAQTGVTAVEGFRWDSVASVAIAVPPLPAPSFIPSFAAHPAMPRRVVTAVAPVPVDTALWNAWRRGDVSSPLPRKNGWTGPPIRRPPPDLFPRIHH